MDKTEIFLEYKNLLFTVAYNMLGSIEDAEDIVDEVYMKWNLIEKESLVHPKAYLVKMVTNNSINFLNSAKKKREEYSGLWLPEPLETIKTNPAESVERYHSLSIGLLMVLEKLTAYERAVFLLKEVFSYDYTEISEIIDKTDDNCRQIFRRAKLHLNGEEKRFTIDIQAHEKILKEFVEACNSGNLDGLISILKDDIMIYADGGGTVVEAKGQKLKAGKHPPEGKFNVAKFMVGITAKFQKMFPDNRTEFKLINGSPAVIFYNENIPIGLLVLQIKDNMVKNIFVHSNPQKLKRFL